MLIIGLTGGIGSGKTSTAQCFAKLGVPVIDADILARELTQAPSPVLSKIIEYFGKSILTEDGHLDRKQLREIIFNGPQKRLWLENLLHPLINQAIKNQLSQLNSPYCIVVIPLLVETGPYSFLDRILVIDAPEQQQIERLKTRDQTSPELINKILSSQADRQARLAAADDIIINDGEFEHLAKQVEKLHAQYLRIVKGTKA